MASDTPPAPAAATAGELDAIWERHKRNGSPLPADWRRVFALAYQSVDGYARVRAAERETIRQLAIQRANYLNDEEPEQAGALRDFADLIRARTTP